MGLAAVGNSCWFAGHLQVMRATDPELKFERLYREYGPDVLAFCRRRAPVDIADDVTAETFLVVWRRLSEVPRAPRGWLLGIARLTLANQHRGERRRNALSARIQSEGVGAPERSETWQVLSALQSLPDIDQEALLLSAWDGLTAPEAAQVLGCTPSAFRLRLHRARRRLGRALATEDVSEPSFRLAKEELR
jgi:RNA polymerase sigma-70 factor, ECF subfamily